MKKNADDILITVFHHPIYTVGRHEEDEKNLINTIVPLFEQYGVDIVFSGHNHSYERSVVNGITYVVTGGGGAPLYNQERESSYNVAFEKQHHFCLLEKTGDELTVTVYNVALDVIDNFSTQ